MTGQFNLGYFLKSNHIKKGFSLIRKQIKEENPFYNTMDFEIYRSEQALTNFNCENFYNSFVKNDIFYYKNKDFSVVQYLGVKDPYSYRSYHFLSFHMLLLYYGVGFYLGEILNKYLDERKKMLSSLRKNNKIGLYYGGDLNINEPDKSDIFYHNDYKEFTSKLKKSIQNYEKYDFYILKIDIRDFFYNIRHGDLLKVIEDNAFSTCKKRFNFTSNTKNILTFFLSYLTKSEKGLIVSSNNLISSFLSNCLLFNLDDFIIEKYVNSDIGANYFRYMDDLNIIFKRKKDMPFIKEDIAKLFYNIEIEILNYLECKLGLSLNASKTKRYQVSNKELFRNFLEESKLVSLIPENFPDISDVDENTIEKKKFKPNMVLNEVIRIIHEQKNKGVTSRYVLTNDDSNKLNLLLIDKHCSNYVKGRGTEIIENSKIFNDLPLELILLKPKPLLYLMTFNDEANEFLTNYIIKNVESGPHNYFLLNILEKFILQLKYHDKFIGSLYTDLTNYICNLSNTDEYHFLLKRMIRGDNFEKQLDKYIYDIEFLNDYELLMQQIKLKIYNLNRNMYNVAFNHLLNEFVALFEIIYPNQKGDSYNREHIIQRMIKEKFKNSEIRFIADFHDRRNNNSISHTSKKEYGYWAVSKKEYMEYEATLLPIMNKVLNNY